MQPKGPRRSSKSVTQTGEDAEQRPPQPIRLYYPQTYGERCILAQRFEKCDLTESNELVFRRQFLTFPHADFKEATITLIGTTVFVQTWVRETVA